MGITNVVDGLSAQPELRIEQYLWGDVVSGSAAAIISAGLATLDELPGQPGCGKTMCTFVGKTRLTKGYNLAKRQTPELYRKIVRLTGEKYCVHLGISKDESARRFAAAREPQGQVEPRHDQLDCLDTAQVIYHPNATTAPLPRVQQRRGGRWPSGVISMSIERQRRRNVASALASKLRELDLEIARRERVISAALAALDFPLSELALMRQQRRQLEQGCTLGKKGE